MAPKKKGPRSGRQGAAAGEGAEPPLSERRQYLHRQHKGRSEELQACKQRVEQLTADNRLVDSEAARLREENPFPERYASTRAQRCANSAHRRERESGVDLSQIYRQRAELTSIYRAREDGLRAQLLDTEAREAQMAQQARNLQLGKVSARAPAGGPGWGRGGGCAPRTGADPCPARRSCSCSSWPGSGLWSGIYCKCVWRTCSYSTA